GRQISSSTQASSTEPTDRMLEQFHCENTSRIAPGLSYYERGSCGRYRRNSPCCCRRLDAAPKLWEARKRVVTRVGDRLRYRTMRDAFEREGSPLELLLFLEFVALVVKVILA